MKQTPFEPFSRDSESFKKMEPASRAWNIIKKALYGSGIILMVLYCMAIWVVFTIPLALYFLWFKLHGGQP